MATSSKQIVLAGRYGLRQRLGAGNFGEVWRARDSFQADDRIVVKLLGQHVGLAEVLLENQLLTRLRIHERIVTIRNVSIAPPLPFIVMDYLPGGSVSERLAAGQVSVVQAVRWAREGLDGLAHAHDMGVLHRDIKPANLLLDADDRAVLSDFGIAEDTIRNLLANPAVYIPHKAPELDTQPSSKSSDIWAMGCTLYRLLTGDQKPFVDEAAARAGTFADPHRVNPQVPMSLTRVVRRALTVDPAHRYRDARAMLEELVRCEIRHSWELVAAQGALEAYEAQGPDGRYLLTVCQKRRGFEVKVTRDMGKGPRSIFRKTVARASDADRERRNCLVAVVAGKSLR